jgi:hypothetical protein
MDDLQQLAESHDKIPRLDEETIARLRAMQPHERIAICLKLNQEMRERIAMLLRRRFPNWPDQMVQEDVARRMLHGLLDAGLCEDHHPIYHPE